MNSFFSSEPKDEKKELKELRQRLFRTVVNVSFPGFGGGMKQDELSEDDRDLLDRTKASMGQAEANRQQRARLEHDKVMKERVEAYKRKFNDLHAGSDQLGRAIQGTMTGERVQPMPPMTPAPASAAMAPPPPEPEPDIQLKPGEQKNKIKKQVEQSPLKLKADDYSAQIDALKLPRLVKPNLITEEEADQIIDEYQNKGDFKFYVKMGDKLAVLNASDMDAGSFITYLANEPNKQISTKLLAELIQMYKSVANVKTKLWNDRLKILLGTYDNGRWNSAKADWATKWSKLKIGKSDIQKIFKNVQSDALGDYSYIGLPSFKFFIKPGLD